MRSILRIRRTELQDSRNTRRLTTARVLPVLIAVTLVFLSHALLSRGVGLSAARTNESSKPAVRAGERDANTTVALPERTKTRALLAASASSNAVNPAQAQERTQLELVTIRTRGFEPAQITRSKGRFVLAVYNRSGLEEVNLHLDQEAGVKLRQ